MPGKNKRILMVGPFPEPTTGVSLANQVVHEILEQEEWYNTRIINTSYSRFDEHIGKFSWHKFLFNLAFYPKAFQVFSSDIIYITPGQTFFGVAKYLGFYVLGALSRKRIITHVHGNHLGDAYASLKGLKRKLFYALLSKTTTGIVLSNALKGNMTPFIPESQIEALPNFAQEYLSEPKPSKEYGVMRIIYLSNLMAGKGIFELLNALKKLETMGIPYQAKIAGAIDYKQKEEINLLLDGLKNTTYEGVVRGEEKKDLLSWGNIFALPTYYKMEGQPISILEAMATGNVIVTTAHAGIPDVITDGEQGFFVQKHDAEDLYNCFEKLSSDLEKLSQIGTANVNYFQANFTKLKFRDRLLKIIQNV